MIFASDMRKHEALQEFSKHCALHGLSAEQVGQGLAVLWRIYDTGGFMHEGENNVRFIVYKKDVVTPAVLRRVVPTNIYWGTTPDCQTLQWQVVTHDTERNSTRTFPLSTITKWALAGEKVTA